MIPKTDTLKHTFNIPKDTAHETVPFLLHLIVIDLVKSLDSLSEVWVAVTFAVAEFPLLLEDTDLIFQVFAGQVVLWEHDVHFEVLPSYVKVALIETDQSTVPLAFLYFAVFVFVIVFAVDRIEIPDEYTGTSVMVSSK